MMGGAAGAGGRSVVGGLLFFDRSANVLRLPRINLRD